MSCRIVYQSRVPGTLEAGQSWLCLGKGPDLRVALGSRYGWGRELALHGRLHEIGRRLRQPFLDMIEEIGSDQHDIVGWWSSTLSWKVPSSDIFLFSLYLALVHELVQQSEYDQSSILIIVEDPWLFRQLQFSLQAFKVSWGGSVCFLLFFERVKLLLLGILKRLGWAVRTILAYIRQRKAMREVVFPIKKNGVAFYSLPQARCIAPDRGWTDPYLGDLHTYLVDTEFCRFSPPGMFGFDSEIADRGAYFWPLILHFSWFDLLRSLTALFFLRTLKQPMVGSFPIDILVRREWWLDVGRAAWSDFHFFYLCMNRFLASGLVRTVVFPYENQPWEKLTVLAAKTYGVSTIGFQHATIPSMLLSYFLGKTEARFLPLPDLILTSGQFQKQSLEHGGTPAESLRLVGSLRYQGIKERLRRAKNISCGADSRRVLVLLPLDDSLLDSILGALKRAFPDQGHKDGITFVVRPHPVSLRPSSRIKEVFPVELRGGNLDDAMSDCGTILFQDTTAGFEAWLMGKSVLRYRAEMVLDIDPCEFLDNGQINVCSDADFRESVIRATSNKSEMPSTDSYIERYCEMIFGTVETEELRKALSVGPGLKENR